jgi:hypothetical protein
VNGCIYRTKDGECDLYNSWCDLGTCASRKPSYADRIREKSDEELAEFLGTLPCCPPGEDVEELCFPLDSCEGTDLMVKCWLDWLRQEAT